ncbi:metal-dependent hydrolase [Aquabacterium sp. A7-Y]|uniref:metal-dependent hydrolase n=1 Tax=Aquabacterium sp. A7-Y TaxID=1349605 RepID=UPI00223C9657|nr:metal-dependent hydrolase [Aquabacterium sp. A7-Y]MCW7541301.1 metal-dependent hydrolase [Aquabacterium sp. A7-Y]
MAELVVRRLLIDLTEPFPRHWNGGDAFKSAFLNALSMSFPVGEQFFIDAVREGVKALPAAEQERFKAEVAGFIGQEATHRRIHGLFNGHLQRQGYANTWETRAKKRIERMRGLNVRHPLAVTAAYEHFTAILAEHLLAYPHTISDDVPRLKTMWLWHAAEESEHKSTAFDLYQALGGNHKWRMRWFYIVTLYFMVDATRQTVRNLWHDGELFKWRTWKSAASFLFGAEGLVSRTCKAWGAYKSDNFHPTQQETDRSATWLRDHAAQFTVVGQGR